MTRDSHLQSKNLFRQLFEVAHHLSNSWPSFIRWHAFWLEYMFLKILNQTWSSPALQRCSTIRLPLPLTDWLPVDQTHFSRHLLIPIWQLKGQTYFFFWNIPRHHADDTIKWKAKHTPPPGFPQEPCREPCSCQWRTCFGSTYISTSSTCCSSCS